MRLGLRLLLLPVVATRSHDPVAFEVEATKVARQVAMMLVKPTRVSGLRTAPMFDGRRAFPIQRSHAVPRRQHPGTDSGR